MLNATQRIFASVLFLLLVSAMITGGALARLNGPSAVGIDGVRIFSRGIPISDGQFIAQTGNSFHLSELSGSWSLLFFGYTYCPDVCPMTLANLSRTWKRLPLDVQAQLNVVLVSVDPERDTPASMAPYMGYFNPSFMALTGNPAALKTLATEVNAFFARVERDGDLAYLMDHSANIVLIDPAGQYRGYIEPPLDPQILTSVIQQLVSMPR